MKRIKTLLLALIMTTMTLSGCIGNSDVETSEGDDVELGESTDDWPTYYVQSSGDLPTCDSSTLGRLYYVEDDVNFQACMSTGWEVVDIGGANSNIVLNSPPVLSANVWRQVDRLGTGALVDDGDGTMSVTALIDWFAYDVDGTIASVGIDYDLDGVSDFTLPGDTGAVDPQSTIQLANGRTVHGMFLLPLEEGISITQITNFAPGESDPVPCGLIIQKSFSVIAEDNSGAKTIVPIVAPIDLSDEYDVVDSFKLQQNLYQALSIPQSDIDWLTGQGTSTCPIAPTFTVVDHPDSLTSNTGDNIVTITISDTSDWSDWNSNTMYGQNWYVTAFCVDGNGDYTFIEDGDIFNGLDEDSPQDGDTISIIDNSWGNCDATHTHLDLEIRISNSIEPIRITIPIS
ncbi:MAG: hypothetical protein ACPGSV_06820 [Candidatus Poseidoniaceae archaeon]